MEGKNRTILMLITIDYIQLYIEQDEIKKESAGYN